MDYVLGLDDIGDDELDTMQTAHLEPQQEYPPARSALALGELNRQDLAAAIPVDADRDQHGLADDDSTYPRAANVLGNSATLSFDNEAIGPNSHVQRDFSQVAIAGVGSSQSGTFIAAANR